jgi:pyruvate,water dikinase
VPHEQAIIAPVVQAMVDPDTAGVLFTANPVSKSRDEIVVEANWGLGESVVSGKSMNDYYVVSKANRGVLQRKIAAKTLMVVMDDAKGRDRSERAVPEAMARKPTLSDSQLQELVGVGLDIERAYGFNVDVEWAYQQGVLFVLQARQIRDLN